MSWVGGGGGRLSELKWMSDMPDFGMDDGVFCWLWLGLWLGLRWGLLRVFGSFWRGRDVAEPIIAEC